MDLLFGRNGWGGELLSGLGVTLTLAVVSYALAFVCAIGWAMVANARHRFARMVWRVYASVMTGVPSLLVVFLVFYNLPRAVEAALGRPVEISQLSAGIVALTLVYAAYLAEILRLALSSIGRGQFEAARALGLHPVPLYLKVIFPQVWRLALPGMSNIWLVVLKDTVLVSLVGLTDIVRVANVAAGNTGQPFVFYGAVGVVFLLLAVLSEYLVRRTELRLERPYRRAQTSGGQS